MRLRLVIAALAGLACLQTAHAQDGAALFGQHCATCHQPDAAGTVGLAPPLKGEHWMKLSADRGYIPAVMLWGLSGPIRVGNQNFVGSMPAFGTQLDDAQLAAIASHLRKLQGANEAPYTADDFKAERGTPGGPTQSRQRRLPLLAR